MLIIPAIDLRGGKVVRLLQGDFKQEKVYSSSPAQVAKHWARCGAQFLHIVDLDGAQSGLIKNLKAVKDIISQTKIPLEFGGGVRSIATIDSLLDLGVERVVLGTKAAVDKVFLAKAFKKFGDRVIVSIDAREGKISTQGWKDTSKVLALDFAMDLKKIGFKQVIYTDISKDGMLSGPNVAGIKDLIKQSGLDVVASGGISSLGDLVRLKSIKKVKAVIIGKALYEGNFSLTEALKT